MSETLAGFIEDVRKIVDQVKTTSERVLGATAVNTAHVDELEERLAKLEQRVMIQGDFIEALRVRGSARNP